MLQESVQGCSGMGFLFSLSDTSIIFRDNGFIVIININNQYN